MQRPCLKTAIIGGLLLLTTLLSGCGALRLAYGRAADITYWWLDGYVDFDTAQTERVGPALARLADWHRASQLPDYAELLGRLRAQVLAPEPVTPAQVCRWADEVQARIAPLVDQAVPVAAQFVPSLTPEQVRHLQRKHAKVNATYRDDYLQPDAEDRLDAATERVVERTESLYGRLDGPQKDRIRRLLAASPFDPAVWLAERQERQKDTIATLRQLLADRAPPERVEPALRALVSRVQSSPREAYRAYDARLRAYNCDVGAQVHNGMTREQRAEAAKRLQGWADDFRALAAGR